MSNAKQCDRCGQFYSNPGWDKTCYIVTDEWRRGGKKFDFCPDCERKLVRWLKDEVEE